MGFVLLRPSDDQCPGSPWVLHRQTPVIGSPWLTDACPETAQMENILALPLATGMEQMKQLLPGFHFSIVFVPLVKCYLSRCELHCG